MHSPVKNLSLVFILFSLSCKETRREFVAKVGETILTSAMLDSALRGDVRTKENFRQAYIQDWINSESLYQKALADGFDKDASYQKQIGLIRKELLIQSYVESELERISVLPSEIESYYNERRGSFTYTEDHIKVEYFLTHDKGKAKKMAAVFSKLSRLRKKDFVEMVSAESADSDVVSATDYLTRDKFEDKVAKAIFLKNTTDEIIGPVPISNNFYSFWHVVEIRPKGTPMPLNEINPEIESRIKAVKRKKRTEELTKKIRGEMNVEYGSKDSPSEY